MKTFIQNVALTDSIHCSIEEEDEDVDFWEERMNERQKIYVSIPYYYPFRAFGGQNKIVYSTRFLTRRGILLILPGQYYYYCPGFM